MSNDRQQQQEGGRMKQYQVFESEGGYRFAGSIWAGGPVLDSSPWYETKAEANAASDAQRERDAQWLQEEMDRLGLAEADLCA
jgi:hypothetical protein